MDGGCDTAYCQVAMSKTPCGGGKQEEALGLIRYSGRKILIPVSKFRNIKRTGCIEVISLSRQSIIILIFMEGLIYR